MSVTVNFTFEKKHFLIMGLFIAIPFLILAINTIMAAAPTGQYHLFSELFVDNDIDMNNNSILNSGNITITNSDSGIIFPDGSVQSSASVTTGTEFVSCSWYKNGCPTGTVNEASPATNSKTKDSKEYYGSVGSSYGSCWNDCTTSKSALDCCKDNINPNTVSTTANGVEWNGCGGWWCRDCGQNCYGPSIVYHWCCPE